MDQTEFVKYDHGRRCNQTKSSEVWDKEWAINHEAQIKALFKHRLFIEGYPHFKKYIPSNAQKILDVGAGTGRYGIQFARDFPDSRVFLTDISQKSIALMSRIVCEWGIKNVTIQHEDVHQLTFQSNFFDVVFCDVVIQHLPARQAALDEMLRVAKPGGTIIISAVNILNMPHTIYKALAKRSSRGYQYGFEKSFSRAEIISLYPQNQTRCVADDGFFAAYGIYRLKYCVHPLFGFLGKVCNRAVKIIDSLTRRYISRRFGFEIFAVYKKRTTAESI